MGTQQTIWHHRYATHPAYKIKYNWVKVFIRNMVPRFLLEGVYVVSHYVHHALSDEPGDPYNAKGGFWYCMLSEENHQCIARNLSENDYKRARNLLVHSGIYTNSYEEY
jgi:stearoyl-CoA desaturase (delta-9 desaturase)